LSLHPRSIGKQRWKLLKKESGQGFLEKLYEKQKIGECGKNKTLLPYSNDIMVLAEIRGDVKTYFNARKDYFQ
jgi:hypothetical protein